MFVDLQSERRKLCFWNIQCIFFLEGTVSVRLLACIIFPENLNASGSENIKCLADITYFMYECRFIVTVNDLVLVLKNSTSTAKIPNITALSGMGHTLF